MLGYEESQKGCFHIGFTAQTQGNTYLLRSLLSKGEIKNLSFNGAFTLRLTKSTTTQYNYGSCMYHEKRKDKREGRNKVVMFAETGLRPQAR